MSALLADPTLPGIIRKLSNPTCRALGTLGEQFAFERQEQGGYLVGLGYRLFRGAIATAYLAGAAVVAATGGTAAAAPDAAAAGADAAPSGAAAAAAGRSGTGNLAPAALAM